MTSQCSFSLDNRDDMSDASSGYYTDSTCDSIAFSDDIDAVPNEIVSAHDSNDSHDSITAINVLTARLLQRRNTDYSNQKSKGDFRIIRSSTLSPPKDDRLPIPSYHNRDSLLSRFSPDLNYNLREQFYQRYPAPSNDLQFNSTASGNPSPPVMLSSQKLSHHRPGSSRIASNVMTYKSIATTSITAPSRSGQYTGKPEETVIQAKDYDHASGEGTSEGSKEMEKPEYWVW